MVIVRICFQRFKNYSSLSVNHFVKIQSIKFIKEKRINQIQSIFLNDFCYSLFKQQKLKLRALSRLMDSLRVKA